MTDLFIRDMLGMSEDTAITARHRFQAQNRNDRIYAKVAKTLQLLVNVIEDGERFRQARLEMRDDD